MIDIHVPTSGKVKSVASVAGYITDGLDAVVLSSGTSRVYEGCMVFRLTGNERDLRIATERAMEIGGVVD
jgi:hypothetical protein